MNASEGKDLWIVNVTSKESRFLTDLMKANNMPFENRQFFKICVQNLF